MGARVDSRQLIQCAMEEPESRAIAVSFEDQVIDLIQIWVDIASDFDGVDYEPMDCPIDIILLEYFDDWALDWKARGLKSPTIICLQASIEIPDPIMNMNECRESLIELLEQL
jgi:hypothetical protein